MKLKEQRQVYFLYLVLPFLTAAALELLTHVSDGLLPLQGLPPIVYYAVSVVFTFFAFACLYVGLCMKDKSWGFRIMMLPSGAAAILLDYFLFGDKNLLYFIPVFAIAYLFLWPKEKQE